MCGAERRGVGGEHQGHVRGLRVLRGLVSRRRGQELVVVAVRQLGAEALRVVAWA